MHADDLTSLPVERLVELQAEILASRDPVVIEDRLRQLISGYGVYNVKYGYDKPIWRARKCPADKPFKNVREMWCPPISLCKAGRLNDPKAPLLYVSMSQFSVLEEVDAQPGDHIQIIGFSLGTNLIRAAFVGEYTHVHRWGMPVFAAKAGDDLSKILRELEFRKGLAFVYRDAFLASLLRDADASRDDYIRSRTVARLLFEKLPELDAIVYQGVAIDGAFNMAIKPDSAKRLLKTGAIFLVKVKKQFGLGFYDFEIVGRVKGQWLDGTLDW